ncbi:TIGR02444 family protein [Rhodobacterales bacterium HKCCE2091]|nr:TIGR02444 family protein [Rhodobacterales bacterium HKCCE2091]
MAERFWDFSLRFYGDPAIQADCLALQDRHGADVNVALCLLWHASRDAALAPASVASLDAAIAPWRAEVVRPLRELRRKLKETALVADAGAQESFRSKLKAVELSAEKLQQSVLETAPVEIAGTEPPEVAARANLAAYAALLDPAPPGPLIDRFAARLAAIGPSDGADARSG